jgi:hypothetical protein
MQTAVAIGRQVVLRFVFDVDCPERACWPMYELFSSLELKANGHIADVALAAKLANERDLELSSQGNEKEDSIKDFFENSPFKVVDKAGSHEVTLTREFGNEQCAHCLPCSRDQG